MAMGWDYPGKRDVEMSIEAQLKSPNRSSTMLPDEFNKSHFSNLLRKRSDTTKRVCADTYVVHY